MTSDGVVYNTLVASGVLVFWLYTRVPRISFSTATVRCSLLVALISIVSSGLFYRHFRSSASLGPGFDTWTVALDISFAHVVVSLSMIVLPLALIVKIVGKATGWIGESMMYDTPSCLAALGCIIFLVIPFVIAGAYGTFVGLRFLLVDTTDMQALFFGGFDPDIGWKYPTTFRFTIIWARMTAVAQAAMFNDVLSAVFSFTGFTLALVLGLGNLAKALANIDERFVSRHRIRRKT